VKLTEGQHTNLSTLVIEVEFCRAWPIALKDPATVIRLTAHALHQLSSSRPVTVLLNLSQLEGVVNTRALDPIFDILDKPQFSDQCAVHAPMVVKTGVERHRKMLERGATIRRITTGDGQIPLQILSCPMSYIDDLLLIIFDWCRKIITSVG
jgi:hypothetical protein